MVFVIFWVTFFPLISQALTGTKVSVGPPAFRPFIVPLALILVLLSGIGPIIAWRRVTVANLRRNFTIPVAAGLVTFFVLLFWPGGPSSRPFALIMFALAAFVLTSVVQEFWRGVVARRAMTHDPVPLAFVAADPPQPPALRRLHRPRRPGGAARRRRRLLVVPALPRT